MFNTHTVSLNMADMLLKTSVQINDTQLSAWSFVLCCVWYVVVFQHVYARMEHYRGLCVCVCVCVCLMRRLFVSSLWCPDSRGFWSLTADTTSPHYRRLSGCRTLSRPPARASPVLMDAFTSDACSRTLFKGFLFFFSSQPPPSIPALSLFGFQTQISLPFHAVKTHFYVLMMTNWLLKDHLQSLSKIL